MNDDIARQADALRRELRRLTTERLERKLLPYEGRWLDAAAVAAEVRAARRRAWVHVTELLLLFTILGALSFLLIGLVRTLAY